MISDELSQCVSVRSVSSLGWLDNELLSLANLLAHCTCLCAPELPNHFHCSTSEMLITASISERKIWFLVDASGGEHLSALALSQEATR